MTLKLNAAAGITTRDNEYNKSLQIAFILSILTIGYNILEGVISVFFGLTDETLSLLGFGIDSFIEVISGVGIGHMILRMKKSGVSSRDKFERQALKITGTSFYILTFGLTGGGIINLLEGVKPDTTVPGIIISIISLLTMYFLMTYKLKIGKRIRSDAIVADANCTKTCFYLSIILLSSSLCYELFRIGYIDIIGSMGIAYFAFREGQEALKKSRSNALSCSCEDSCSSQQSLKS